MNNGQPPSAAAMHRRLNPLKHALAHAPVTADTKLLVVCPSEMHDLAATLDSIIRHHQVNPRGGVGSVQTLFCPAPTEPTLSVVRNRLLHDDLHYDLIIIYGYKDALAALSDQALRFWIAGWAKLVKVDHPHLGSGHLLIELHHKPEEIWTDTALRYDELLYNEGIRLLAVNSLCGQVATDQRTLIQRFRNLALHLERGSDASLSRFISYIKTYAQVIKDREKVLNKDLLEPGVPLLGLFIPDKTTCEHESRWKDVDGSVIVTSLGGAKVKGESLVAALTKAWKAGKTPKVGTEPYFDKKPPCKDKED